MAKEPTTLQIELMFSKLNGARASDSFPPPATLSRILNGIVDKATSDSAPISQIEITNFATAAVEMWHRAIHSFLISASLTKASPIWSSVSGYYSSHYSIRGFAHLLGYFQLNKKKRNIQLEINGTPYLCHIKPKGGNEEHKFYWMKVHEHPFFITNSFFPENNEYNVISDSAHRNKANYFDHLNGFPPFQVLDEIYLKQRVSVISKIEIDDAPIPNSESDPYPDIENVQIMAYHRMVKFREFIDNILGGSNRFWNVHRKPSWCPNFLNFQLVKPESAKEKIGG